MFGLAASASAACALACAAPLPPSSEPQPFALTPAAPAPAAFALTDRAPLADVTGEGWSHSAAPLGANAQLNLSVYDTPDVARPGGLLPSDAFRLSSPRLSDATDGPAVRVDAGARVFDASAGQFDFDLGPHAVVATGPAERYAGAGIAARLGENLERAPGGPRSWYLFANYGRKAVTFDPRADLLGITEPDVSRKAVVGDAQAGVAFDLGHGAGLALSYTRRERAFAKDGWGEGRHDGFAVLSLNIAN